MSKRISAVPARSTQPNVAIDRKTGQPVIPSNRLVRAADAKGVRLASPEDQFSSVFEAQLMMAERQMAMQAEYQKQSLAAQEAYNEAMRAMSVPTEPEKAAADAASGATANAMMRQQRRRGLLSTFTRYGDSTQDASGKSTILGV